MGAQVTLYHVPPSFYSQLARLALSEKGVVYAAVLTAAGPPLFETYEPWYMRLNPQGTVPTLVDAGGDEPEVVADSRDILTYVDANFDGPALIPSEPNAQAEVEALVAALYANSFRNLSYGSAKLSKIGHRVNRLRIANLRKRITRTPELAAIYEAKLRDIESFNRDISDRATHAAAEQAITADLDELDARLADGRPFLTGDTYTLADLAWTVGIARLRMIEATPLAERAALRGWYERMRARPSFAAASVWERTDKAALAKMLLTKLWSHLLVVVLVVTALIFGLIRLFE